MFVRRIAVIGAGYVGLSTGACLASLGRHVTCADVDAGKIARLARGEVSILEPDRCVVDTRNLVDHDVLRRVGFHVRGIGR